MKNKVYLLVKIANNFFLIVISERSKSAKNC